QGASALPDGVPARRRRRRVPGERAAREPRRSLRLPDRSRRGEVASDRPRRPEAGADEEGDRRAEDRVAVEGSRGGAEEVTSAANHERVARPLTTGSAVSTAPAGRGTGPKAASRLAIGSAAPPDGRAAARPLAFNPPRG